MGESETELCQQTQRERPCQGCQGLQREGKKKDARGGGEYLEWLDVTEEDEDRESKQ